MENKVVVSTLPLFASKAVVLFDSGATHSFIVAKYAKRFHINIDTYGSKSSSIYPGRQISAIMENSLGLPNSH